MQINKPVQETNASMLQKLRVRCKLHPTLGDSPALVDILQEANEYVYKELDDGLPIESTLSLFPGIAEYDTESDEGYPIGRGSIDGVWLEHSDSYRAEICQGITHEMRAVSGTSTYPERYDTKYLDDVFTLEVWPKPDRRYKLYIRHNRTLLRFTEPNDKPSAPARLVLQYAIAMGKAHYSHADADTAGQAFKSMLREEKYAQHENRRYTPGTPGQRRHQVVKTANGFVQVG